MELEAGFSLSDIALLDEKLDVSKRITLHEVIREEKQDRRKKELSDIITLVDGIYYAFASVQSRKNYSAYKSWRDRIVKMISKEKQTHTIWDKLGSKTARRIR